MKKIISFTDLLVWQKAHLLVLEIYRETGLFPSKETYSLTDQMRRAVVSVTSNIAEGFCRQGQKEKIQFYYMSLGSLSEIQNQLIISKDLNYLKENHFTKLLTNSVEISKLLNGLIKSIKINPNYLLPSTNY